MRTERLPALPPRYGDPFYRGRGRGRGRDRGRREWLGERLSKRETNRGFEKGSFCRNGRGNGRGFHSQAPSERDQRDRLEEDWSIPASVERRDGDIPVSSPIGQESPYRTPPTPAPSEDRLITDWSSIGMGSPLVRTLPQSVPMREGGQDINQPTNQTTQPGLEPPEIEVMENDLQEDLIVSTPRT